MNKYLFMLAMAGLFTVSSAGFIPAMAMSLDQDVIDEYGTRGGDDATLAYTSSTLYGIEEVEEETEPDTSNMRINGEVVGKVDSELIGIEKGKPVVNSQGITRNVVLMNLGQRIAVQAPSNEQANNDSSFSTDTVSSDPDFIEE